MGAGESGIGACILAKKYGAQVFLSDKGKINAEQLAKIEELGIEFEQGHHDTERILKADLIIKSPGIPDTVPFIVEARALNIPVISEIEFAGYFNTAKTICITGSNGKTTTTMLTYHILKKAGMNVGLAGNVGKSFAAQVARWPK